VFILLVAKYDHLPFKSKRNAPNYELLRTLYHSANFKTLCPCNSYRVDKVCCYNVFNYIHWIFKPTNCICLFIWSILLINSVTWNRPCSDYS
jgi:hypothetical protein